MHVTSFDEGSPERSGYKMSLSRPLSVSSSLAKKCSQRRQGCSLLLAQRSWASALHASVTGEQSELCTRHLKFIAPT